MINLYYASEFVTLVLLLYNETDNPFVINQIIVIQWNQEQTHMVPRAVAFL